MTYHSRKKRIHENHEKLLKAIEEGKKVPNLKSRYSATFGLKSKDSIKGLVIPKKGDFF